MRRYTALRLRELTIVTMDKDFSRMLLFPPEKCGGIIAAKFYGMKVDEATKTFIKHFKSLNEKNIRKKLVIFTKTDVRIRPTTEEEL